MGIGVTSLLWRRPVRHLALTLSVTNRMYIFTEALRSVLFAAHQAMMLHKAGPKMLLIAVYASMPIKVLEVQLKDMGITN